MEKICKNCKYWNRVEEGKDSDNKVRVCKKIKMYWDCTEWVDEEGVYTRKLKSGHKNDKAFVQDGSDYSAILLTSPEFGCNQLNIKWLITLNV